MAFWTVAELQAIGVGREAGIPIDDIVTMASGIIVEYVVGHAPVDARMAILDSPRAKSVQLQIVRLHLTNTAEEDVNAGSFSSTPRQLRIEQTAPTPDTRRAVKRVPGVAVNLPHNVTIERDSNPGPGSRWTVRHAAIPGRYVADEISRSGVRSGLLFIASGYEIAPSDRITRVTNLLGEQVAGLMQIGGILAGHGPGSVHEVRVTGRVGGTGSLGTSTAPSVHGHAVSGWHRAHGALA